MSGIRILSMPELFFAHTFRSEQYHSILRARRNAIEVSYVYKGSLELRRGEERFHAGEGDILFNAYNDDLAIDADAPHEHHTVCFRVEHDGCEDAGSCFRTPVFRAPETTLRFAREKIDAIIKTGTLYPEDSLSCSGDFLLLVAALQNAKQGSGGRWPSPYVRRAKNYIYAHLNEPIRQSEIAASLGITPEYLCAVFKSSEGESLMHFMNRVKLEGIRKLMMNEHITLSCAAAIYGYSDASYVSRLYRKYFGMTISEAIGDRLPGRAIEPDRGF